MKILIVQLARLGDIYLNWPMIKGLKTVYPNCSIDLLVRPRFSGACLGLSSYINKIHELPVQKIFEPLVDIDNLSSEDKSVNTLTDFMDSVVNSNYDWVINCTFSPASSFICSYFSTAYIKNKSFKISGYTRYTDGFLSLPDEVSSYFYAQVGIGKFNRLHLSEIFCLLADINPEPEFWKFDNVNLPHYPLPFQAKQYVVIHVGASQKIKTYPSFKWRATLVNYFKESQLPIVIIGGGEDKNESEFISYGFETNQVLDLTNKTSLSESFEIIKNAALLVGCDSAPIHMASLMNTPTLNLSFESVNFWETGPKSEQSRVLFGKTEVEIPSETLSKLMTDFIQKNEFSLMVDNDSFLLEKVESTNFSWSLIEALYMNKTFPEITHSNTTKALQQIYETNQIMIEQLNSMKKFNDVNRFKTIYDQADQIMETITLLAPELLPLLSWYQAEKIKIGPENTNSIFTKTLNIHMSLNSNLEKLLHINKETSNEQLNR